MSQLFPSETTVQDICIAALKDSGALGVGQSPLAEDIVDAWSRLQWMLQQWERKRWLVWTLQTLSITSTGQQSYSIGPGGDIDTNPFTLPFGSQFGQSVRPDRIESAFLRQLTQSQPNQIDYPLELLHSREDYNKIALKTLTSFPGYLFYDSSWPLGQLFPWPVPQASIYALHVSIKVQLPTSFASAASPISVPYECYQAMISNLALRLRPKYGIVTQPGDSLPGIARDALNVLRTANAQIGRLTIPANLQRAAQYNIFSDRMY